MWGVFLSPSGIFYMQGVLCALGSTWTLICDFCCNGFTAVSGNKQTVRHSTGWPWESQAEDTISCKYMVLEPTCVLMNSSAVWGTQWHPPQVGLHSFWPWRFTGFLSDAVWMNIGSGCLHMGGFGVSLPSCLIPIAVETRCLLGSFLGVTGNNPKRFENIWQGWVSWSSVSQASTHLQSSLPTHPLWPIHTDTGYFCK